MSDQKEQGAPELRFINEYCCRAESPCEKHKPMMQGAATVIRNIGEEMKKPRYLRREDDMRKWSGNLIGLADSIQKALAQSKEKGDA